MSSILDALKKLERESSPASEKQGWPDIISYRRTGGRSAGILGLKIMAALIAAGFILWGGVILFGEDEEMVFPEKQLTKSEPEKYRVNGALPGQGALTRKDHDRQNTIAAGKRPPPESAVKKTMPEPPGLYRSNGPTGSIKPIGNSKTITPPVISKKAPLLEETPEDASAQSMTPGDKSRQPELSPFTDPRIDLQAIAWDPESENSFVVVNNEILREGDSVSGIKILEINKDSVSFQDGRKSWRQVFTVR